MPDLQNGDKASRYGRAQDIISSSMRISRVVRILPIPAMFLIILHFMLLPPFHVPDPSSAVRFIKLIFGAAVPLFAAALSGIGYLHGGHSILLLPGAGMLGLSVSGFIDGISVPWSGSPVGEAAYGAGMLVSAICSLIAATGRLNMTGRRPSFLKLLIVDVSVFLFIGLCCLWEFIGMPAVLPGGDGTPSFLNRIIAGVSAAIFAVSFFISVPSVKQMNSPFLRWYGTGCGFLSVGLFGVMNGETPDGLVTWAGRISLYAGSLHVLCAVLCVMKNRERSAIPLPVLEESLPGKDAGHEAGQPGRLTEENPDPVIRIDPSGRLVFSNDAAEPIVNFWASKGGVPEDVLVSILNALSSGEPSGIFFTIGDRIFSADVTADGDSNEISLVCKMTPDAARVATSSPSPDPGSGPAYAGGEFRTTVDGVIGLIDILAAGTDTPERIGYLNRIREAVSEFPSLIGESVNRLRAAGDAAGPDPSVPAVDPAAGKAHGDSEPSSAAERRQPVKELRTLPGIPPLSMLIAEDNRINSLFLELSLKDSGHSVKTVENGQEVLDLLTGGSEAEFDLILMDIQMPVMDGPEAARRIRKLEGPVSKIPIIALTAFALKDDEERFREAGMNGYVTKPVDMDELARIIRSCRTGGELP